MIFWGSPHQSAQHQEFRLMPWKSLGGNGSLCNSGFGVSSEWDTEPHTEWVTMIEWNLRLIHLLLCSLLMLTITQTSYCIFVKVWNCIIKGLFHNAHDRLSSGECDVFKIFMCSIVVLQKMQVNQFKICKTNIKNWLQVQKSNALGF